MKKAKKVVALALCAVMLVVGSVAGTMAYLTYTTETVTNTFTVGNVIISLTEAAVDVNGDPIDEERRTENEYHLMPGHAYDKDPTVFIDENSENCYLFVTVDNNIVSLEDPDATIAEQMVANGWEALMNGDTPVTLDGVPVYVYAEDGAPVVVTSDNEGVVLFETLTVSGDVDDETFLNCFDTNNDGVISDEEAEAQDIKVVAYAVQEDGFEDETPFNIWNATFGA